MRAGRGDKDHPEIVLAGLCRKVSMPSNPPAAPPRMLSPSNFFGDAPLVRARGVFIETKEQEGEEAEGEE